MAAQLKDLLSGRGKPLIQTTVLCAVLALPALTGGMELLYFITPLPVAFYLNIHGFERGSKIIAHAALIAGILSLAVGKLPILIFSMTLLPVGFVLAKCNMSGEDPVTSAMKAIAALIIAWFLLGLTLGAINNVNVYTSILDSLDKGLEAAYQTYQQSGSIPGETMAQFEAAMTTIRDTLPKVFPAMIGTTAIATVCLNMMAFNWLLLKTDSRLTSWSYFRDWRLPENLVWAVVGGGVAALTPLGLAKLLGINLLLLAGMVYFFQGLAVLASLFERWSVPKPIRFLVYLLLGMQAYGFVMLATLGLADTWANFRKPRKAPDEE